MGCYLLRFLPHVPFVFTHLYISSISNPNPHIHHHHHHHHHILPSLNQMDNQQFENWIGHEGLLTVPDDPLDFSLFPRWEDWQLDYSMLEGEIVEAAIPLMQRYPSEPRFPPLEEFNGMFDDVNGAIDIAENETNNVACEGEEKTDEGTGSEKKLSERSCGREERNLTFGEVSRYFYMPIMQAAKELNVGLTLLKKKCRELGIPRWPHRKMKSLETLIRNVQELGRPEEGGAGVAQLRDVIELLEQERRLMEKDPAVELEEKTKRLRQACFKANYKKRRLNHIMAAAEDQSCFSSTF